VTNTN